MAELETPNSPDPAAEAAMNPKSLIERWEKMLPRLRATTVADDCRLILQQGDKELAAKDAEIERLKQEAISLRSALAAAREGLEQLRLAGRDCRDSCFQWYHNTRCHDPGRAATEQHVRDAFRSATQFDAVSHALSIDSKGTSNG